MTPHPFGPFARAALLTGMPSPENGVRDYYDPLPLRARTIARELGAHGYATAFFGKWHLYQRDPAAPLVGEAQARIVVPPEAHGGFEFWEGFESGYLLNDPWLHGTRLPAPVRFPGYQSDVLCTRASRWIAECADAGAPFRTPHSALRNQKEPWFCVVSMEPPHPPYDAPAAGVAPRDPRAIGLPANVPRGGEVEGRARRELAGYYAQIEATDRAIGGLLDHVPVGKTIVVFTSVHGDMHGAHGLFRKGWPHEEAVRVPLLVRGARRDNLGFWVPGSGSGKRNAELVSLLDLPRWTLAWAGAGARKTQNPEPETPFQRISMPCVVRQPHQCDRPWSGVRMRTRKLVLNADGTPWMFFDLERDPGEARNLAGDPAHAAEIAGLRRQFC